MRMSAADQAVIPVHAAARLMRKFPLAARRPRGGVVVQACSGTVCVPVVTDSSGGFVFEQLAPGSWDLAVDPGSGSDHCPRGRPGPHAAGTARA